MRDQATARDGGFVRGLRERVKGEVREGERLGRYSTYRIGGPATVLLPASGEDVGKALRFAAEAGVPWFAIGLGSNLLLPDDGLDALVIRLGKGLDAVTRDGERWTVGAGLPAPRVARMSAEAGLGGLHIFVGVPGTVGGGVYMNAGCHGGDWADVVERVTVVDESGQDSVLSRAEVPFSYRRSGLTGRIVLDVTARLRAMEQARLDEEISEMFEWRQQGTPFNQPCCGSVFKNPGGPSWKQDEGPRTAGQLVEAAGLKGARAGGAEVSPMHANYIVNAGEATAKDVQELIAKVQGAVAEQFGVRLETEVKIVGSDGTYA